MVVTHVRERARHGNAGSDTVGGVLVLLMCRRYNRYNIELVLVLLPLSLRLALALPPPIILPLQPRLPTTANTATARQWTLPLPAMT